MSADDYRTIVWIFDSPYKINSSSTLMDLPDDALRLIFHHLGKSSHRDGRETSKGRLATSLPFAMTCRRMLEVFYSSLSVVEISNEADRKFHYASDEDLGRFIGAIGEHVQLLKLGPLPRMGVETIRGVAVSCTKLQGLDLVLDHQVHAMEVSALFTLLGPRLRLLRISAGERCDYSRATIFSGHMTRAIGNACSNLEHLTLDHLHSISRRSVLELFRQVGGSLRSLCVSRIPPPTINDDVIRTIALHCTNLERLEVCSVRGLNAWSILALVLTVRETLRVLRLSGPDVLHTQTIGTIFTECKGLRDFRYNRIALVMEQALSLEEDTEKKGELRVNGMRGLSDEHCRLAGVVLSGMERIHLTGTGSVGDMGVTALCGVGVKSVSLEGCAVGNSGLKALAMECPMLEELSLVSNTEATDAGVSAVFRLARRLKEVTLIGVRRLTGRSLSSMGKDAVKLQRAGLDLDLRGKVLRARRKYARLVEIDIWYGTAGLRDVAGADRLDADDDDSDSEEEEEDIGPAPWAMHRAASGELAVHESARTWVNGGGGGGGGGNVGVGDGGGVLVPLLVGMDWDFAIH